MAEHSLEIFFDHSLVESLRMIDSGLLPLFEISPASFISHLMTSTVSSFLPRKRFTDFKGLLEDHIKFEEIESLLEQTSPILLIGAANILKGNMKIFNSRDGEIIAEAVLASAAIPNLFPAVQIGEDYYWDGLFSSNPPVMALVQAKQYKGEGMFPDEIWIILINPLTCKNVPTRPNEIVDRRNEMIGNVSVIQEVNTLMMLGRIFKAKGFTKAFVKELGYTNPEWVKIR
ncbi:MAG TPA: patatin-like phospholipase family protein, partial [Thermodesulfobacteriota bacterium]|nr:patatin-like phospholipase family protein [Thermodesulfobacteriota bacterium]